MRVRYVILAALVTLCCFAADASAQGNKMMIYLANGHAFEATVLEADWDKVKLSRDIGGGQATEITLKISELDPHFVYSEVSKSLGNDAKERINLAKFCVDHGMFARAKAEMDRARAADPAVVEEFMQTEFPKIKDGLADRILKHARQCATRGSHDAAKRYASLILTNFEGTAAEPEAEKLLDDIQAKMDAKTAKKREQRRKSEEAKEENAAKIVEQKRDSVLGPIEKAIDSASTINTRGLKTKNMGQARREFDAAGKKYESAIKKADKALEQGAPDEATTQSIQEMRATAVQGGVRAYLNAAHALSSRGTYQEATAFCNRALVLDPENAEALSARATISTTSGGWGVRGGGRRR